MGPITVSEQTYKDLQNAIKGRSKQEQFDIFVSMMAARAEKPIGTISDADIERWNRATPGKELDAFAQVQAPKNALPFANFLTADKTTDPGNEPAPGG